MGKKALIVGVDHYQHFAPLPCCIKDAHSIEKVLSRNADGSKNFDIKRLEGKDDANPLAKKQLKDALKKLFGDDDEVVLFYFSGHGYADSTGGYIFASDATDVDEGVPLTDIVNWANASAAKNKIIILDSCYSGIAGSSPVDQKIAAISEGVTILTASTLDQTAIAGRNRSVFTSLLVDALNGGAANLLGQITPGSVYAHIDQSLGNWEQRPVFKTNVKEFITLRKANPTVNHVTIQAITKLFPAVDALHKLDPTYEPELKGRDEGMPPPDPKNTKKFAILQLFRDASLVEPVDAPHMWHAAMQSKSCKLTVLGQHYWRLVKEDRI